MLELFRFWRLSFFLNPIVMLDYFVFFIIKETRKYRRLLRLFYGINNYINFKLSFGPMKRL